MPTFGSLFSGIGGLDLGLERAGWECRWQVEIDEWCRRVLERHWPTVPKHGAIEMVEAEALEIVDLICGGFPCQPASKAGGRSGADDSRWLWPELARILRALRPPYALLENVTGLLTVNGGGAFGEVLGDLASLGYSVEWDCLPARALGAPHQRDRLFVLAYPHGDGPILPSLQDLPVERREPPQLAADSGAWWASEPDVGRVVNGIPTKLDERRIGGLGNAVVPQVAEWIGRRLMSAQMRG